MGKSIFTIGHSNHECEHFIALLKSHTITAIADVRSSPYSRYADQFNRETLLESLKSARIAYVFLGNELGAKWCRPDCCSDGRVDFELVARTGTFRRGLDRLRCGVRQHRPAIMCAEKDPITCHRMILIARHISALSLDIFHISENGGIETQHEAESRILAAHGLPPDGGLFQTRAEMLDEAYRKQGREIAYQLTPEDKERMYNAR